MSVVADTSVRSEENFRVTRSRRNVAWTGAGALIVVVVLLTSDPKVMGDRTNPPALRWLGWATAVVMTGAAAAMFWTWNA